jgi:hypothetical protein
MEASKSDGIRDRFNQQGIASPVMGLEALEIQEVSFRFSLWISNCLRLLYHSHGTIPKNNERLWGG